MSKHSDPQNFSESSQDESEVMSLLKKMQQHLTFLEKKIDLLVENSSQNSFKEKRFSRPGRSGGYSGGFSGRRGSSSEGNGFSSERSFGRSSSYDRPRRGGQSQGFGEGKKRPYRSKREQR
ncbi:MAG: hypothetical protein KC649_01150 [Candidatus Omnitrophica bacterium]|nr:hypothetical protein [Candidatus Omnitrophota bacterium]